MEQWFRNVHFSVLSVLLKPIPDIIRVGDRKVVYQLEILQEEQLIVTISGEVARFLLFFFPSLQATIPDQHFQTFLKLTPARTPRVIIVGKQRHIRLTPVSLLEAENPELIKIPETKGCSSFCTGLVRQGTSTLLCVACKRTIFVYELNRTKARHRRVKEIQCVGQVQYIEMVNERLCVGYPSTFAVHSVQGDAAPMGKRTWEGSALHSWGDKSQQSSVLGHVQC